MTKISELAIPGFLDALAARRATPGGGGAAALTGSQAAALISMAINFTVGSRSYAHVQAEMEGYLARSEALRRELLELVDADAAAFDAVTACYGMSRTTDGEKAARAAALQRALQDATRVPYAIAERCLALLQIAVPVGARGNRNVVGDALTAVYLARAALLSAVANVSVNLRSIRDGDFVSAWTGRRDELLAAADQAYRAAMAACAETLGIPL